MLRKRHPPDGEEVAQRSPVAVDLDDAGRRERAERIAAARAHADVRRDDDDAAPGKELEVDADLAAQRARDALLGRRRQRPDGRRHERRPTPDRRRHRRRLVLGATAAAADDDGDEKIRTRARGRWATVSPLPLHPLRGFRPGSERIADLRGGIGQPFILGPWSLKPCRRCTKATASGPTGSARPTTSFRRTKPPRSGGSTVCGSLLDEDPANANAWSPDGFTALHLAIFGGSEEAVRLLLERGADVDALATSRDRPGEAPRHGGVRRPARPGADPARRRSRSGPAARRVIGLPHRALATLLPRPAA